METDRNTQDHYRNVWHDCMLRATVPLTVFLKAVNRDFGEVDSVFAAGVTVRWDLSAATPLEQIHWRGEEYDVPKLFNISFVVI